MKSRSYPGTQAEGTQHRRGKGVALVNQGSLPPRPRAREAHVRVASGQTEERPAKARLVEAIGACMCRTQVKCRKASKPRELQLPQVSQLAVAKPEICRGKDVLATGYAGSYCVLPWEIWRVPRERYAVERENESK